MGSRPDASSIGGAANEAGSLFRAETAAWFVSHGFIQRYVDGIGCGGHDGHPVAVYLEGDAPLDDIQVELSGGRMATVQAKRSVRFGGQASVFASVVDQWRRAAETKTIAGPLVLAVGDASGPIRDLASALERRRSDTRALLTTAEERALTRLLRLLNGTPKDVTSGRRSISGPLEWRWPRYGLSLRRLDLTVAVDPDAGQSPEDSRLERRLASAV